MFQTEEPLRRGTAKRAGLVREIAFTLLVKLMLLYGIWWVFFSEPQLPDMIQGLDPGLVADRLASPSIPKISNHP
ncbi:MAG: cytochrome oxidase putative small subunit CydP [Pseudomonadota bacterium]